jgi:hypothetical protein
MSQLKLRWKVEFRKDFFPSKFIETMHEYDFNGLVCVQLSQHYHGMCRLQYFDEEKNDWVNVPVEHE